MVSIRFQPAFNPDLNHGRRLTDSFVLVALVDLEFDRFRPVDRFGAGLLTCLVVLGGVGFVFGLNAGRGFADRLGTGR